MRKTLSHAARALKPRDIRVVHGHGGEQVRAAFAGEPVSWIHQAEQRGTGHAVRLAMKRIKAGDVALVLYGDVPLIEPATLRRLVAKAASGKLAVLTAELADPKGYGRIVRDAKGEIVAIIEEKDASREQRAIREINTGLLACPAGRLLI